MALPDVELGTGSYPPGPAAGGRVPDQAPAGPGSADHIWSEQRVGPDQMDLAGEEVPDLPAADLLGGSLTVVDHIAATGGHVVRRVVATARETTSRPGGLGSAQPESWAQYRARVRARNWVPEEYRETWQGWVPAVFYATVGNLGWAAGASIQWLCTHMLAFVAAFFLTVAAVSFWFIFN